MKCKICGKEDDPDRYYDDFGVLMKKKQLCFNCVLWERRLEEDAKLPPHTYCVIDGTHYVIEPDAPNAPFQGFGGARFQIEFNDGHKVITHNLWCQGDIPEHFKDKFPDNAKFENNLKWRQIGRITMLC